MFERFRLNSPLSIAFCFCAKTSLPWKPFIPPTCKFSFMQFNSFSFERFCTKLRLVMKQRHKVTQKCPIRYCSRENRNSSYRSYQRFDMQTRGTGLFCFVFTLSPRLCAFRNKEIFDSRLNSNNSYCGLFYSSIMQFCFTLLYS